MDDLTFRELCLTQALGLLDEKGQQELFLALEHADEKRLEFFAETVSAARHHLQDAQASGPSPHVRERVMAMAKSEALPGNPGQPAPKPVPGFLSRLRNALDSAPSWLKGPGPAIAFASLAFAAGLSVHDLFNHGRPPAVGARAAAPDTALLASQSRIVALEDSLSRQEALLAVLSSRQLQVARLKGQGEGRSGIGRVMWDPQKQRGILQVANLPPAPAGQVYHLWILVDDKKDPCLRAGSFKIRQASLSGDLFRFESEESMGQSKLLGFEVTLESKVGHPHPSGPSLLRSETLM
ncbi:MAG: Anti-sigma-K factor RskA [Fibrobacteres bacterium]|nr:Anti-sigma-K factor RskA [Fibrobacterota bacterium]